MSTFRRFVHRTTKTNRNIFVLIISYFCRLHYEYQFPTQCKGVGNNRIKTIYFLSNEALLFVTCCFMKIHTNAYRILTEARDIIQYNNVFHK